MILASTMTTDVLPWVSALGVLVLIPLVTLVAKMLGQRLDKNDRRVDDLSCRVRIHGETLAEIRQSMRDNCPCSDAE